MTLNDMFEHIYCINLDSRSDRWAECEQEFAKHGIKDVERFSAVSAQQAVKETTYTFPVKPGEAGLILTHRNILVDALKHKYESILILEDDVEFADSVHDALEDIPDNWDIVYFGGNHAWGQPIQLNNRIAIANKTLAMHCVGLKNTVYDRMLERNTLQQPIDVTYANNLYLVNSYVFVPSQAWQRPSFSDLMGHHVDYGFLK